MKKNLCIVINILYTIVCFFVFLIQNGLLILPGTTEVTNYAKRFTESFQSKFEVLGIVVGVAGIGVMIYDFLIQKELQKINKSGCILALCVTCFSALCLLVRGLAPITCLLGLVASILMIIPVKE